MCLFVMCDGRLGADSPELNEWDFPEAFMPKHFSATTILNHLSLNEDVRDPAIGNFKLKNISLN